jgi:hypothetical protein
MYRNTLRYEQGDGQTPPGVYWRRRFLALVAGLSVLALIAWAFAGVLGGSGTGRNAADVNHTRSSHRVGAAGAGVAAGAQTPDTNSPAAAPSASASVAPGRGAKPGATTVPAAGHSAAPTAGPPACRSADVVISVFASQDSFGQGQPPEFNLDVVSTADGTCAFNIGPRFLTLVIRAGGKRVWGSADCAAAPGSVVTDLARGVPTMLPVTWDLQTSVPGCRATAAQATAGSYSATASDDGVTSNPVTFRLE